MLFVVSAVSIDLRFGDVLLLVLGLHRSLKPK